MNEYERAEEELGKSAFDEDRRDEGDRKTMEVWPSKKVLKKLERKKANEPDEIPNEAFIEADTKTKEIYLNSMNELNKVMVIPEI